MIYICLSVYNEERNIEDLFSRLSHLVSQTNLPCHIFAFNDASTDRTQETLLRAPASIPVTVIQTERNHGFGYAIRHLIDLVCRDSQDENDVAIFMDADNSHDPESIPQMLAEIERGSDLVIASRFRRGSEIHGFPAYRRMLSKAASLFFRAVLPLANVSDFTSGYRAWRVSALRRMQQRYGGELIREKGFACQIELLSKLPSSSRVPEVPMRYFYNRKLGGSKMKLFSTIFQTLRLGGRIALRRCGNRLDRWQAGLQAAAYRLLPGRMAGFLCRHGAFLLIAAIALLVRSHRFGSVPPGLFQDEASLGYDAFSLLHYGVDRMGTPYPVMLPSWGSGMYALPAYLSMPFLALSGLTATSVRLPFLLYGMVSLIVFYALARRGGSHGFAVLCSFLLAISPWHIILSRYALDSNLFPAIFLIAVFLLALAQENRAFYKWSALFFGLSLYTYGTAYVVLPVFLCLASAWLLHEKRITVPALMRFHGIVLAAGLPIIIYVIINTWNLGGIVTPFFSIPKLPGIPRFQTVSGFSGTAFLRGAIRHFGIFLRLLNSQSDGLPNNCAGAFGQIYPFSMPFALLGLCIAIRRFRKGMLPPSGVLMLAWFFSALALPFLLAANVNRMNILYLPVIYFLATGLLALRSFQPLFGLLLVVYSLSFAKFAHYYFTAYPRESSYIFSAGLGDAILYSAQQAPRGPICVMGHINQPYIFVLFYTQPDPRVFFRTAVIADPKAEFHQVTSFDRYLFNTQCFHNHNLSAYIANRYNAARLFPASKYTLASFGNFSVAIPNRH